MVKTSPMADLQEIIQLLEIQQAMEGQLLKEQFYKTYESLKPINLLRSTISDVVSSPYLINNLLGTALGLVSGYVSKKIVVGASGNLFRKLIGVIAQLGVTNSVTQHQGTIKSIGQFLYQHLLPKKEL
jgi:hypothetical protein